MCYLSGKDKQVILENYEMFCVVKIVSKFQMLIS